MGSNESLPQHGILDLGLNSRPTPLATDGTSLNYFKGWYSNGRTDVSEGYPKSWEGSPTGLLSEAFGEGWRAHPTHTPTAVPTPKFVIISVIQHVPPYKNKEFLTEKYVEKGWSTREIAQAIGSGHQTILKALKDFEIPIRKDAKPRGKPGSGLAYGTKVIKNESKIHKREAEVLEKMKELRTQGFSYEQIAKALNAIGIPTKTKKSPWAPKTVWTILNRKEVQTEGDDG